VTINQRVTILNKKVDGMETYTRIKGGFSKPKKIKNLVAKVKRRSRNNNKLNLKNV